MRQIQYASQFHIIGFISSYLTVLITNISIKQQGIKMIKDSDTLRNEFVLILGNICLDGSSPFFSYNHKNPLRVKVQSSPIIEKVNLVHGITGIRAMTLDISLGVKI